MSETLPPANKGRRRFSETTGAAYRDQCPALRFNQNGVFFRPNFIKRLF